MRSRDGQETLLALKGDHDETSFFFPLSVECHLFFFFYYYLERQRTTSHTKLQNKNNNKTLPSLVSTVAFRCTGTGTHTECK